MSNPRIFLLIRPNMGSKIVDPVTFDIVFWSICEILKLDYNFSTMIARALNISHKHFLEQDPSTRIKIFILVENSLEFTICVYKHILFHL